MERSLTFALLLLSNLSPTIIVLSNKRWELAPLVYCAGNALWIAQGLSSRASEERPNEGLSSVWVPCLLMTVGALSWGWVSQPAVTLNNGLGFDGLHYAGIYS